MRTSVRTIWGILLPVIPFAIWTCMGLAGSSVNTGQLMINFIIAAAVAGILSGCMAGLGGKKLWWLLPAAFVMSYAGFFLGILIGGLGVDNAASFVASFLNLQAAGAVIINMLLIVVLMVTDMIAMVISGRIFRHIKARQ